MKRRTLYECSHARVNGNRIYCRKEYPLSPRKKDRNIEVRRLARGDELALTPCQNCRDFDCMGPPIPPEERGWIKKKGGKTEHSQVAGKAVWGSPAPGW